MYMTGINQRAVAVLQPGEPLDWRPSILCCHNPATRGQLPIGMNHGAVAVLQPGEVHD